MFDYLFLEIIEKVYKSNRKRIKDLSCFEKVFLLLWMGAAGVLLLLSWMRWKYTFAFLIVFAGLAFAMFRYKENKEKAELEKERDLHRNTTIKSLKNILCSSEWNMYNPEGMRYMQKLCTKRLEDKCKKSENAELFQKTFTTFVFPIITLVLGSFLTKAGGTEIFKILFLYVTIVMLVCGCVLLITGMRGLIKAGERSVYENMLEDLKYLEITYDNKHQIV